MPRIAVSLAEWFATNAEDVGRDIGRYFGAGSKDRYTGRWFDLFAAIGDEAYVDD